MAVEVRLLRDFFHVRLLREEEKEDEDWPQQEGVPEERELELHMEEELRRKVGFRWYFRSQAHLGYREVFL